MSFFTIENLSVQIQGRQILKDFSLNIDKGEVHVLLGPNGAGKTTLIKALLGFKNYQIIRGSIYFKGHDITTWTIDERIKLGIGVLFQSPPAINGVKLSRLLTVCNQHAGNFQDHTDTTACEDDIQEDLLSLARRLNFSSSYLHRDVNLGFSGGEVKRSEILQMMVLKPDLLLFDEPDSGVDVENVELIASIMRELLDRDKIPSKQEKSGLIITHLGYILKFLGYITRAHVMLDGRITCSGNPAQIINAVMKNGFDGCRECKACSDESIAIKEVDFTL